MRIPESLSDFAAVRRDVGAHEKPVKLSNRKQAQWQQRMKVNGVNLEETELQLKSVLVSARTRWEDGEIRAARPVLAC